MWEALADEEAASSWCTGKRNEPIRLPLNIRIISAVCLLYLQLFHVFFSSLDKDIIIAEHYSGNRQPHVEISHWMTMYNLCNPPPSPFNKAVLILHNTGLLLLQES